MSLVMNMNVASSNFDSTSRLTHFRKQATLRLWQSFQRIQLISKQTRTTSQASRQYQGHLDPQRELSEPQHRTEHLRSLNMIKYIN